MPSYDSQCLSMSTLISVYHSSMLRVLNGVSFPTHCLALCYYDAHELSKRTRIRKKQTYIVVLDFNKAFDKVSHNHLSIKYYEIEDYLFPVSQDAKGFIWGFYFKKCFSHVLAILCWTLSYYLLNITIIFIEHLFTILGTFSQCLS